MGCCLSVALCCCFREACHCLCACCPPCNSTTATKIAYLIFLVVGVIVACIFTAPAIGEQLLKFESFCNTSALYIPTQPVSGCAHLTSGLKAVIGFPAVYRVCFALAIFFFVLMILMLRVKSSKDCRANIQNGFWFFKGLIVIGIVIGAFFIHNPQFELSLMVIGSVGAFLFYIVQMTLLIDFAYKWTSWWMGKFEETDNKLWFIGTITFSMIFYAMFVAVVVLLYIFYANGDCHLQQFFVSINLILCLALSAISVVPHIQKYNPRSGLLQSSIVSLYIMYITWTAVNSSPNCNPLSTCHLPSSNTTTTQDLCISTTFSYDVIVPLIVFFICAFYAGLSNGSTGAIDTVRGVTQKEEDARIEAGDGSKSGFGQEIINDEEDGCRYNYSFLHFIYLLAVLFIMMTITHWILPNVRDVNTTPAMWVKISSSWLGLLIYLWTLIAPLVLKDRTFS